MTEYFPELLKQLCSFSYNFRINTYNFHSYILLCGPYVNENKQNADEFLKWILQGTKTKFEENNVNFL